MIRVISAIFLKAGEFVLEMVEEDLLWHPCCLIALPFGSMYIRISCTRRSRRFCTSQKPLKLRQKIRSSRIFVPGGREPGTPKPYSPKPSEHPNPKAFTQPQETLDAAQNDAQLVVCSGQPKLGAVRKRGPRCTPREPREVGTRSPNKNQRK